MPQACGLTSLDCFSSNGLQNDSTFFGLSCFLSFEEDEFAAFSLFKG